MTQHASAAHETIGERLKRLRLERGLSQRELAAPGVSYAYISRIEAGTRQPSVKALRRLAAKLGVTAEYLETGSQLAPSDERELRLSELELSVRLGDWQGKREPLEEVLGDALAAADSDAALRARLSLAIVAQEEGDLPRVVALLEAAVEHEPFAPIERPSLYIQLGKAQLASGRPEDAADLYERCLATVREQDGPPSVEARFAASLSAALAELGEVTRAEEVVREAIENSRRVRDLATGVRIYWSLAQIARADGHADLALANMRRAIALLETTEATVGLARANLLAAEIAITRADADEAALHLDYAQRLLGAAPSFVDSAALRVKRAQIAALRRDGTETVALAREALDALGDRLPEERGAALAALAEGLALSDDHDGAHDAYSRAVEVLERQRRWREATHVCRSWARMLRAAGREQEALDVLDRAAELGLRATPAESR